MKRIMLGLVLAVAMAAVPVTVVIDPAFSTHNPATQTVAIVSNTVAAATCEDGVELSVTVNRGDSNCLTGDDIIIQYVKIILRFLTGGIGLVILLILVVAGIQYITANGQPANVAKAKDRIKNAITALILFAASFAILSFLIPGGIFK